ncbi:hypothetical protein IQ228_05570 [Dolichospermum sp. LEGE 00246]|nr:hypothetical protein [Dolichospermum sp. LEGE 00246]
MTQLFHQETEFQRNQRHIIKRIIIRGNLILDTPTCLGSGDSESPTDLSLLRDSVSNHALLTGASIAGAIRNYLREYQNSDESSLFGGLRTHEDGDQSPLIINDAISSEIIQPELRDGVKINSVTRTADPKKKYDLELLQAGAEFPLCFELLIEKESDESSLIKGLAIALQGLKQGEISLGIKKHRGFGRCHIKEWQVWQFDLTDYQQRLDWLRFEHWQLFPDYPTHELIAQALNVSLDEKDDQREFCKIDTTFTLASPLLIRSGQASSDKAPDVVHLKSRRNGELKPVLSGTSLAGVLRHRAERIINTIGKNVSIIEDIFGSDLSKNKISEAKASRLIVHESVIENTTDLVQNRIAIDRFTGGTLYGALFNEQPIFSKKDTKKDTHFKLNLELRNPENHEIGLLLLLLKDLWTGDLPVGGTSSIGRGRLQGKDVTITLQKKGEKTTFTIVQSSPQENLVINDADSLEKFVSALNKEVNK